MREKKNNVEKGQAATLVVVALAVFLIGAVGLAIDGSHLYAERQMAQAAADAAAQAGIRSIYTGSNVSGASGFSTASSFTCATGDTRTPCYYAQSLNGFNSSSDTVVVDFPGAATVGVPTGTLSSDPVNLLRVTISRQVPTTLFKFISSWTPSIQASATGAIVSVMAPVPIIVSHPWLDGSFSLSGTGSAAKITICGGPQLSVQVNSSSSSSISTTGNPVVDLSHGGPADPGDCSVGTGSNFGDWGGPGPTVPSHLSLSVGSTGIYQQPSLPIDDPLSTVSPPSVPSNAAAPSALANGVSGCPASPAKPCMLYKPGLYSSSNLGSISVSVQTAVFSPGIYYMNGVDFSTAANGYMTMATGLSDGSTGTNTGWTGNMLVYMTGPSVTTAGSGHGACSPPVAAAQTGQISVGANGSVSLTGSPSASTYKGILFFVDRTAVSQSHTLAGGGGLTLVGTVYATDTKTQMGLTSATTCGQYQTLNMQGNAGSSTHIQGEIIASALSLSGTPGIVMNLNPNAVAPVRQVALVQ